MSSTLQSSDDAFLSSATIEDKIEDKTEKTDLSMAPDSTSDLFLRHRLRMVEEMWEAVLQQECGQQLVDLLRQLRSIYSPEGEVSETAEAEAVKMIENLDLNEAIRAARAFALYFQLINIVEQHYEQRGQQQQYRASYDTPTASDSVLAAEQYDASDPEAQGGIHADMLEKALTHPPARRESGTFQALLPRLQRLNVPPRQIQTMIDQLDVRLVFTAHPTEIVRHTIRD
ncbi:MAG TPA: phosphoenolpyruvate carboxylase, partial [Allocoleopsis sp.]